MKLEDLQNIDEINLTILPESIRKEFDKIIVEFEIDSHGVYLIKNVFKDLYSEIREDFSENDKIKYQEYNKKILEAKEEYHEGFYTTFDEIKIFQCIENEEKQILKVFNSVYRKIDILNKPVISQFKKRINLYDRLPILQSNFCQYGEQVGSFILCWTIILNNVSLFEKIFKEHTDFNNKINAKPENTNKSDIKLVNLFEHTSKYNEVMHILISKKKVSQINFYWIDLNNAYKKELASLIKHFQIKGYYKENKKPTDNEVKEICKNTFGVDIGISTIQHSKATYFDFNYIPYPSTLENKVN